jgi:hypothetical protein
MCLLMCLEGSSISQLRIAGSALIMFVHTLSYLPLEYIFQNDSLSSKYDHIKLNTNKFSRPLGHLF